MEITPQQDFQIREWTTADNNLYSWIKQQFQNFHNDTYKLVHVVSYTKDDGKTCLVHYFQKI